MNRHLTQPDVDRRTNTSAVLHTQPWVDYPVHPLDPQSVARSPVYSGSTHRTPRLTSDHQANFYHSHESPSYNIPAQNGAEHTHSAGSRQQTKRFSPYPGSGSVTRSLSGGATSIYDGSQEASCLGNSRVLLCEQPWDSSDYHIPPISDHLDYYQPEYLPSPTYENLVPQSHRPYSPTISPVHTHNGGGAVPQVVSQPISFEHHSDFLQNESPSRAYIGDILQHNEALCSLDPFPSHHQSSNSVIDNSLYHHILDGHAPLSHAFTPYLPEPVGSTIYPAMSTNPSFLVQPSLLLPLERAHHPTDGQSSSDPPDQSGNSQRGGMPPPVTTPQSHKLPERSTFRQQQQTLTLPLSSSLTSLSAAGSSQSVLKLNSHSKKAGASEKKQTLACLFCRERKIACGRPAEGSADSTCNQCARRQFKCEYPKESRRGQHKRNRRKLVDASDGF